MVMTTEQTSFSKLVPEDGAANNFFGGALSKFGSTALITGDASNTGLGRTVYVYQLETGDELAELRPIDPDVQSYFGLSTSLYDTTALVGARLADGDTRETGAVYLFDTTTGQRLSVLTPDEDPDGTSNGFADSFSI